jgi:hypothetical protein
MCCITCNLLIQVVQGALLDAEDASFLDDQPSDSEGQQHVRVQDTSIASKDTSTRRTRWDEVDFNDGLEVPLVHYRLLP